MEPRKRAILDALSRFMNQRSGIEFGNYGDVKAFRAEQRSITKDLHQARTLLMAVARTDGIDADALLKAAQGAFSGRLTIEECGDCTYGHECDKPVRIDYCTGQYFPTEYRRAACAVLASALWEYTRAKCMPEVGAYRVESWAQLGKGRTRHTVVATREAAEIQLTDFGGSDYGSVAELYAQRGPCERITWLSAGDWLRAHFRKEFGRFIAARWFS